MLEEKRNALYILKFFFPLLIILLIDLIIIVMVFRSHIGRLFLECLLVVLLIIGIESFFLMRLTNRRLKQALQSESPQKYIALSEQNPLNRIYIKIVPTLRTSQILSRAIAFTYWGEFNAAREELAAVEWESLPPISQSTIIFIQALFAFLEKNDVQQGLQLAKESLNLAALPAYIPFRNWLLARSQILVYIGQVLQNPDSSIISNLESRFTHSQILLKILIAWGLEKVYHQEGEVGKAHQMRAFLKNTVPNCIPFNY
jgi:hypothetical protein